MSDAPIQFRVIVNEGERTLQWRHRFATGSLYPGDGLLSATWSDWETVQEWDFVAAYQADEEERTELRLKELYGD